MALHHTLEAFALAYADYVNEFLAMEDVDQHAVAGFYRAVPFRTFFHFDGNFAHKLNRRQIVLAQVTLHGLRQARLFHELDQADLRGIVAVFGLRFVLRDHTGASLQHGRRTHIALRIEELRHPDFLSQNSCYLCHFLLRPSLASAIGWGASGSRPRSFVSSLKGLWSFCFAYPGLTSWAIYLPSLRD